MQTARRPKNAYLQLDSTDDDDIHALPTEDHEYGQYVANPWAARGTSTAAVTVTAAVLSSYEPPQPVQLYSDLGDVTHTTRQGDNHNYARASAPAAAGPYEEPRLAYGNHTHRSGLNTFA